MWLLRAGRLTADSRWDNYQMDTVEYDGARIRLIRFNHHMSYCKLLGLLWILSSWSDANNQSEVVTCCIGDDAKFPWTGDVPPFIVIEWYFNNTVIAQTYRGSLSQDTLIIKEDYKDRFHLTRTGDAGFYITNARENDTGEYKCVVTMQGTGYRREQPLKVIDCATSTRSSTSGDDTTTPRPSPARARCKRGSRRSRASDAKEHCSYDDDEPESGEEQPHASDSPAHVHPAAVAVPLGLGVIFIVIVGVVIKRKDFPSAGNHVESRSEPPELEKLDVEIESPGTAISIERATFTWNSDSESTLKNINLSVPVGQLVAIVGSVGAGKSSLLSAMLGEMRKLKGHAAMRKSVAYVPQEAWIQNLSLKANIVFGSEPDEKRYLDVIKACALESDLETLPGGANTEIGEKGINLSGGQKQRVSLARAVYSNKDIYLLDDPLSAVDSHVGKHIFSQVIGHQGMLKGKTRVLVTHGVHWLPMVDVIVVIDQGEITEVGSYEDLLDHDGPFAQFLKTYLQGGNHDNLEDEELQEIRSTLSKNTLSSPSLSSSKLSDYLHSPQLLRQLSSESETTLRHRRHKENIFGSMRSVASGNMDCDLNQEVYVAEETTGGEEYKLIEDEYTETGNVRYSILKSYFSVIGWVSAAGIMVLYVMYNFAGAMSNIWLSHWTEDPRLKTIADIQAGNYTSKINTTGTLFNVTVDSADKDKLQSLSYYYLGVYCAIAFTQAVSVMLNSLLVYTKMVDAAKVTHRNLLDNIIKQPMSFFDTTPTGRILNRFTKDVDVVDGHLPRVLRLWIEFIFNLISILVVISYSTPMFLAVAVPVIVCFIFIQRMYTPTSRQLRRYFSASKSPVFSHFTETINGASSVRAYRAQDRFFNSSLSRVNEHNIFYYGAVTTHRWMKMRLDGLGCLVVFSATLLGVVSPHISPGVVGLSITYALMVTGCLIMMVIMTTELETHVVSVERMAQYTSLPTEAPWVVQGKRPAPGWPEKGHIKFDNLKIRYRPELDLVLKGISCDIKPGEKIGVVGRTGAGKSSLTLALFRILEAAEGRILIDGRDIADMGLHDLRSRLTILPQDPMLFSGTLRLNLDPFEKHSDEDLWLALERAHLKGFVSGLSEGLLHECEEGGHNLSVGQRQLVCLARSLLRRTKVLILDEATAAVDMETDDLIQSTIRTAFSDCTVITIAHRLNTILDYDRIMVLSAGEIVEFASPTSLLADTNSTFYSLAKDANIV